MSSLKAEQIKTASPEEIAIYLDKASTDREITLILNNLGKLPSDFDGSILLPFLKHQNKKIRYLAIKNIGKLTDKKYTDTLKEMICSEKNSKVKREVVSSLGRLRDRDNVEYFISLLNDKDPKIIMQAMRALLVFKGDKQVDEALGNLRTHKNEQIKKVLDKEYLESEPIDDYGDHTEFPEFMKNTIVLGDVEKIIAQIPDGSIHLTFTSPPYYNARDYAFYDSYDGYLNFLERVFREVNRITKEGRFLVVNTSPIIIPRISRSYSSSRYPIPFDLHARLVQLDWEFIDEIVWVKPESSVKARNGGFAQHRKPLGYKPNPITEYLMIYRKESHKLIDWNMNQYTDDVVNDSRVNEVYETSNVWKIAPTHDSFHSATFPEEICNRIIKLYSYKKDLVFDPFAGSGTLGFAAHQLDRYFFMCEIMEEYFVAIERSFANGLQEDADTRFVPLENFNPPTTSE